MGMDRSAILSRVPLGLGSAQTQNRRLGAWSGEGRSQAQPCHPWLG